MRRYCYIYFMNQPMKYIEWDDNMDDNCNVFSADVIDDAGEGLYDRYGLSKDVITFGEFMNFIKSRVKYPSRKMINLAKERFLTDNPSPLQLCEITHGIRCVDLLWIKFDTDPESLSYITAL